MKEILSAILIFSSCLMFGSAQPDSLYNHAVEAYSAGKYEQSLDLFQELTTQGLESSDMYYNMGNAAFRSNKLGYAILYYEKALKLEPGHDKAQANLDYVSLYKEDQLETVPEFFLKNWFNRLFRLLSISAWSYLSLLLFVLTLSSVLLYIYGQRLSIKKAGFTSGLIGLVFFIISFIATMQRHHEITKPEKAVIINPSVIVKSSPSLSGTDLFILHEGTIAVTNEPVGEWMEIKISDGRIGWVPENALEMI